MKRYPLVDLGAIQAELGPELEAAVLEVVRDQQFVGGARVAAFEEAFARWLGVEHAIGMANGTDALELALRAQQLSPGAEVIVPANTFIATAEAVVRAGGVARFADVDPDSGLIDLDSAAARVSERTEVIIPVHLYGRMVDMDAVMAFAAQHGLKVLEDTAQAHGAHRNGRMAGTVGDIGCFSFYPGKNLGAFGDAGAAVTNDPELAESMRLMRDHGRRGRHRHVVVGFNSRLDPIHANVLSVKLPHIDRWNEARRAAAGWYRETLPSELIDWVAPDPLSDVHHVFPILVDDRDAIADALDAAGVQSGVHYRVPVPSTEAFAHIGDECPVAQARAARQLSLPMHPHLKPEDARFIAGVVSDALVAEAV